jgi:hypothetical protein
VWRLDYLIERWTGKPAPAGRVAEINGEAILVFVRRTMTLLSASSATRIVAFNPSSVAAFCAPMGAHYGTAPV